MQRKREHGQQLIFVSRTQSCSEDYRKLLKKLKDGEIKVDRDYEKGLKDENFSNVKLNII